MVSYVILFASKSPVKTGSAVRDYAEQTDRHT